MEILPTISIGYKKLSLKSLGHEKACMESQVIIVNANNPQNK